jgi:hypothetical protein
LYRAHTCGTSGNGRPVVFAIIARWSATMRCNSATLDSSDIGSSPSPRMPKVMTLS